MAMRLAFAIATAIEPEILLLDEGIMAGDALFQAKAQKRVTSLMNRTRVLVLASHSPELLKEWCNKAILLEHGEVVATGTVNEIIRVYQDRVQAMTNAS
jgi:ABC-type polysaccharide/polyol phosphate transport system ATPase subunit